MNRMPPERGNDADPSENQAQKLRTAAGRDVAGR